MADKKIKFSNIKILVTLLLAAAGWFHYNGQPDVTSIFMFVAGVFIGMWCIMELLPDEYLAKLWEDE